MKLKALLAAALLLLSISCAQRGPIVDTGDKPPNVGGTIAGAVLAGEELKPLLIKKFAAINNMFEAIIEISTDSNVWN